MQTNSLVWTGLHKPADDLALRSPWGRSSPAALHRLTVSFLQTGHCCRWGRGSPAAVFERCKALADIERGFKVLKPEIEIGRVYHRLPDRIRAHAQICFMALILHRVMRGKLKSAVTGLSPERALERLARIQITGFESRRVIQ
jgi:hypothetical protein